MRKIVLLAALSGSGKSTAAQSLVEEGFIILENIESKLTTDIIELLLRGNESENIAIVVKLREKEKFEDIINFIRTKESNVDCRKILVTAQENTIINRYQEKRKVHPLVNEKKVKSLEEAIKYEMNIVNEFYSEFDKVIDTTFLAVRDMQNYLRSYLQTENSQMRVIFQSFGFKYGIPKDSDNVIDVRHLPNPFYIEELRKKTGKDKVVQDYVMSFSESQSLYKAIVEFIKLQIKGYEIEKRLVVTFSIGCTGGQHRSVTFVEYLSKEFKNSEINHLEMDRKNWQI